MVKDKGSFSILVIEDNPGDFLLVEEYLSDQILNPYIFNARNFQEAKSVLSKGVAAFDVILLDLTLPDKSGKELICEILKIAPDRPVVILTGYLDIEFSIQSISMGISDYLLKDELNGTSLYKTIIYCIERRKRTTQLKESEKRYSDLFHLNPQPMWVYALNSLKFLDVNAAAIDHYGYTREEFLNLTTNELSYNDDDSASKKSLESGSEGILKGSYRHLKKSGEIIQVELRGYVMSYKGQRAEIVIVNDITEKSKFISAIQDQNKKLRDIAWMQSHVIRAPLARMMGLIDLIKSEDKSVVDNENLLDHLRASAHELDNLIRDISDKTSKVKLKK